MWSFESIILQRFDKMQTKQKVLQIKSVLEFAPNFTWNVDLDFGLKSLLFIQLIIPIIQITLFCMCIGKTPQNLNIGYINLNNNTNQFDIGNEIIHTLDDGIFVKVFLATRLDFWNYSEPFRYSVFEEDSKAKIFERDLVLNCLFV